MKKIVLIGMVCLLGMEVGIAQSGRIRKITEIPIYFPLPKKHFKRVSSGYGYRYHPKTHKKKFHHGLDMAANKGVPIYAAADGTVMESRYDKGYGHYIKIKHKGEVQTLYGHMSRRRVRSQQKVRQGQIIGYVGSTGISTGPHLHFEIIKQNKKIDPFRYWSIWIKNKSIVNN